MLTKKIKRIVQLGLISLLSIGLVISLGYWLGTAEIETAVAAPVKAPLADTCWATIDGVTVYSDTTSSPVQTAVNAAAPNDLIKIAGTCAGISVTNGLSATVYISKSLMLQGGYTQTDWTTPYPDLYTTTLDAQQLGPVVLMGTPDIVVSLTDLVLQQGSGVTSLNEGGGIYKYFGTLTLTRVLITNNSVASAGGGDNQYWRQFVNY